jgi:hypothetical protein
MEEFDDANYSNAMEEFDSENNWKFISFILLLEAIIRVF